MSIHAITEKDLSNLRQWKNDHREFFFYKEEISSEQQQDWFCEYQKRLDDYMFIVKVDDVEIGCMGIRLFSDAWDIYNVIRANQNGKGAMSSALQSMIRFAESRHSFPITVKVLKNNVAVDWYKKNGFVEISEHPDYFGMVYEEVK